MNAFRILRRCLVLDNPETSAGEIIRTRRAVAPTPTYLGSVISARGIFSLRRGTSLGFLTVSIVFLLCHLEKKGSSLGRRWTILLNVKVVSCATGLIHSRASRMPDCYSER